MPGDPAADGGDERSAPAPGARGRPLAARILDLVVYAPAGLVAGAVEDLPGVVAKGRARVDLEVRNARAVGRFAVGRGRREVEGALRALSRSGRRWTEQGGTAASEPGDAAVAAPETSRSHHPRPRPSGTPRTAGPQQGVRAPRAHAAPRRSAPTGPAGPAAGAGVRGGVEADRRAGADAVVDGYDALSASQVVRRLDGLGPDELAAVYAYEQATRRRRTILHRVQQLQGLEPAPGTGGTTAGGAARSGPPDDPPD